MTPFYTLSNWRRSTSKLHNNLSKIPVTLRHATARTRESAIVVRRIALTITIDRPESKTCQVITFSEAQHRLEVRLVEILSSVGSAIH